MDSLIAMRATGPPDEFACKMNLSRSTLFETLQEMKFMGVDMKCVKKFRSLSELLEF
jgi:hypothetical protein